jgi:hypothetical protein
MLEDDFRKRILDTCFKLVGGRRNLSKILGASYTAVSEWYHGKKKRTKRKITRHFCPLWVIEKINRILTKNKLENIANDIQNNITEYRSHSGRSVVNPNLPIPGKPELLNLLAHILGDGCAVRGSMPYYSNTCEELRNEFMNNLKIFGEVECYESFHQNKTPRVMFPTVIVHVLESAFPIDLTKKQILNSSFLFNLPERMLMSFLRGIFDDDGYVHDSNIQICSLNRSFLDILKTLLAIRLKIETSALFKYTPYVRRDGSISEVSFFDVYSSGVSTFSKCIGFTHPKKQRLLEYLVKRQKRGWKFPNPHTIRKLIIEALEETHQLTARELSIKTLLTARNTRKSYLYPMENEGILQRVGKKKGKGGPVLWSLKK